MEILRAFKTKLNPNNVQRGFFIRCAGTSRFIYNWGLADRIARHEAGDKVSYFSQKKRFNALKRIEYPWVYETPDVTESTLKNLDAAYQHFFRRVKNGEEPGFPKFKRKGRNESFQIRGVKVKPDRVYIPKLGWVRLAERGYIPVDAKKYGVYTTISLRAGNWYVSVLAYVDSEQVETSGSVIGVDFGIKELVTCSNGRVFGNPKPLRQARAKLARLNKELSRRKKGGANWLKTKAKLQKAHARVANIRKNVLHEISSYLVYESGAAVIVLENLNVAGMLQNHSLAQAIADVSFSELRRQIEYKAAWAGVDVVLADRWYPSSKTCSRCGAVRANLALSDRVYECESCGLVIDRDLNAAINLAALAEPAISGGLPGELACKKALL